MKNAFLFFLKSFFRGTGRIIGELFSLFPLGARIWLCKFCAVLSHNSPKRAYFLVHELVGGVTKNLLINEEGIFIKRNISSDLILELDITKKTQRQIFLDKVYEPHITMFLEKNLSKGSTFFDIGANVGYYSILASKLVGKGGHVFAFEPEAKNFESLKNNILLNNCKNITPFKKAIANQSGKSKLHIHPSNEGGHSIEQLEGSLDYQQVETISFDAFQKELFVDNASSVVIKIDVEGFELEVLKGMKSNLIRNDAPTIVCEVSRHTKEVFDLVRSCGYKIYSFDNREILDENFRKRDCIFKKSQ